MSSPTPLCNRKLRILSTPPPPRHFLLPSTPYFTPSFYDTLALFLHKHSIRYRSINLVGRGVTREEALKCPAVVVEVWGGSGEEEEARRLFAADERLVGMVPAEVGVVEFVGLV
jgi:hypothetical protein